MLRSSPNVGPRSLRYLIYTALVGVLSLDACKEEGVKYPEVTGAQVISAEGLNASKNLHVEQYRKQIEALIEVNRKVDELGHSSQPYEEIADDLLARKKDLRQNFKDLNQALTTEEKNKVIKEISFKDLLSLFDNVVSAANTDTRRRNLAGFHRLEIKKKPFQEKEEGEQEINMEMLTEMTNLIFHSLNERQLTREERRIFLGTFGVFYRSDLLSEENKKILLEATLKECEEKDLDSITDIDVCDLTNFDQLPIEKLVYLVESGNPSVSDSALNQLANQAKMDMNASFALNTLIKKHLKNQTGNDIITHLVSGYTSAHTNPAKIKYLDDEVIDGFLALARRSLLEGWGVEMTAEEAAERWVLNEKILNAFYGLAHSTHTNQTQKLDIANMLLEWTRMSPKNKDACSDLKTAFMLDPNLREKTKTLAKKVRRHGCQDL